MFLTYLSTACFYYVYMGIGPFMLAAAVDNGVNTEANVCMIDLVPFFVFVVVSHSSFVTLQETWPYWLDRSIVAFAEVLAVAIGVAVGGMGAWHWYLVRKIRDGVPFFFVRIVFRY